MAVRAESILAGEKPQLAFGNVVECSPTGEHDDCGGDVAPGLPQFANVNNENRRNPG
jgi:hypothetical protein